jgi:hypothetical protein
MAKMTRAYQIDGYLFISTDNLRMIGLEETEEWIATETPVEVER